MCFDGKFGSLTRLHSNIYNSADIIEKSFQPSNSPSNSDRLVRRNSSNHSCHILNVDGSCLDTPIRASFGGLISNNTGFFLSGFFGFLQDSMCILLAELTTIHKGLRLASDMGLEDLVCYSDSLLSVNLISVQVSKFNAYAVLVQDIKDILATRNYTIRHTLREGNYCTDFMAKLGATSNIELCVHSSPPHDILGMLSNDAMRVFFPRA